MTYKVVSKYIKKVNFELKDTEAFLKLSENIKKYKINLDIKSTQIRHQLLEINMILKLHREDGHTLAEISHATLIEVNQNQIEKEVLKEIILVKVPSQVYVEIRKLFINLFELSGYKDIKIEENVDFEKLYRIKKN